MKILVIGANGRTGKQVVKALDKHEVISFVGDVLDQKQVESFVQRADVVVSVIGHVKGSRPNVQAEGITNVVSAMKKHKKTRLVSLTGTGVRFPNDKITIIDHILNWSIKLIDRNRIQDGINHAEVIKQSKLEWTILRVLKLTNGPPTTSWKLCENGPAKTLISRADVAQAIKQLIENQSHISAAPIIGRR